MWQKHHVMTVYFLSQLQRWMVMIRCAREWLYGSHHVNREAIWVASCQKGGHCDKSWSQIFSPLFKKVEQNGYLDDIYNYFVNGSCWVNRYRNLFRKTLDIVGVHFRYLIVCLILIKVSHNVCLYLAYDIWNGSCWVKTAQMIDTGHYGPHFARWWSSPKAPIASESKEYRI